MTVLKIGPLRRELGSMRSQGWSPNPTELEEETPEISLSIHYSKKQPEGGCL